MIKIHKKRKTKMITFSVNKNIDLFFAIPRNNQNEIPDNMIKLKDKLSVY
jgi:hypothetical protein